MPVSEFSTIESWLDLSFLRKRPFCAPSVQYCGESWEHQKMQPCKLLQFKTCVIFNITSSMAWFNWFIALNSFGPNLLAVSFVVGWWRDAPWHSSRLRQRCGSVARGYWVDNWWLPLVSCLYVYIYVELTWKGFKAEFGTAAGFLQTLGFPCVSLHEMIGSGQFSSAGYLYRCELLRHVRLYILVPSFYRLVIWNRSD